MRVGQEWRLRVSTGAGGLRRADANCSQRSHLTFDPAMHDEGYVIVPDGERGLAVIAETAAAGCSTARRR